MRNARCPNRNVDVKSIVAPAKASSTSGCAKRDCIIAPIAARPAITKWRNKATYFVRSGLAYFPLAELRVNGEARCALNHHRLFIFSKYFSHGVGYFTYGGVGFDCSDDMRHQI